MARSRDQVLTTLTPERREKSEQRASELATLKDLREAIERTQEDMAARLGVGQDTVSRIERRSDILLSTLRRYVEAMGGELDLVARSPTVYQSSSNTSRPKPQFKRSGVLVERLRNLPPATLHTHSVVGRAALARRLGNERKARVPCL